MKFASDSARQILSSGSFTRWYEADLWYDGVRRLPGLPISDVQISEDDSRAVKASGSCTITWSDTFGESVMPLTTADLFAPFGSELALYARISAGSFQERIPMGWFQIVDVPTMRDRTMFFRNQIVTTGTVLELRLQDRFIQIQRDRFVSPDAPSQLDSVWREIGLLTGMQMTMSLPDAPITRSVVYQEDRLQAVLDLADILGGVPYATPAGTLSMRPKTWGAPVDTLKRGDAGSIVELGRGMSADAVYNIVAFRGQGDKQDEVLSTSEITSGPLRTRNSDGGRSPAHRRPTFRSNQFVTTEAQAQAYTDSELARASTLNAVQWPITEVWNPLRELGDVLNIIDEHGRTVVAQVTAIDRGNNSTQKVTVVRG